MSLIDCLRSAEAQNAITRAEAAEIEERLADISRATPRPGQAQAQLVAALTAEAAERERRALLAQTARASIVADISAHTNARGRIDPAQGLTYVMEHKGEAKFKDIATATNTIVASAHGDFEAALYEFRKGALVGDFRRGQKAVAAKLDNVVRELFGEHTGDVMANGFATSWGKISDDLRQRFNAAGGAIGKLEKWGLPQSHDAVKMIEAGFDQWSQFIAPRLDRDRMRDALTGARMTDSEVAASLRVIYDRIRTDGWIDREPSGQAVGKGALFNAHSDRRFLHFKNADAWLEYQKAFGNPDAFRTMMGHFNSMSRDIAIMERLGPNPEATLTYVRQHLTKEAVEGRMPQFDKPEARVRKQLDLADRMWEHLKGATNMPVSEGLANAFAIGRSFVSSTALGSSVLSALPDAATSLVRRAFSGMAITPMLATSLKSLTVGGRREAVRAGLILDSAVHALDTNVRGVSLQSSRIMADFVTDRVLAVQGQNVWTQTLKHAHGMDFQAVMADHAGRAMADLPAALGRTLDRHGITAAEWDKIRAATPYAPEGGAGVLRPQEIATAAGRDLSEKYLAMILRETSHAVIEPSLRYKAMTIRNTLPGTLMGEITRSMVQFRGFAITFALMEAATIAREVSGQGIARGAIYAGGLLTATTLMGSLTLQLKELSNGRETLDMKTSKFWKAAILQGGGLGIFGDFAFSDVNRVGGSLPATVAGPLVGRIDELRRSTIGQAAKGSEGEKTNVGRAVVDLLRHNTPGLSSLWYVRAAYNRVIMDQLQYLVDKDAHGAFRRKMEHQHREFGNRYIWKPGHVSPG